MSSKHAKSVFYQGMYIINVFHVILYIKIFFAQTRNCMVIVVNRRCAVSNAISSEISMDRKLAWVENCTGNYTDSISAMFVYVSFRSCRVRVFLFERGMRIYCNVVFNWLNYEQQQRMKNHVTTHCSVYAATCCIQWKLNSGKTEIISDRRDQLKFRNIFIPRRNTVI